MERAAPTFEEWLAHAFETTPWERPDLFDGYGPASCRLIAECLAKLFEAPEFLAQRYSGDQLNKGFWFLCGIESGYFWAARDSHVPIELQVRWVTAIGELYEKMFARVCSEHLSHLDEGPAHPLNVPVYMFWDLDTLSGAAMFPDEQKSHHLIEPIFRVLERALALPSIACQESALHGLGHFAHYHPDRVKAIVGSFLLRSDGLRPELRKYAERAMVGYVQ